MNMNFKSSPFAYGLSSFFLLIESSSFSQDLFFQCFSSPAETVAHSFQAFLNDGSSHLDLKFRIENYFSRNTNYSQDEFGRTLQKFFEEISTLPQEERMRLLSQVPQLSRIRGVSFPEPVFKKFLLYALYDPKTWEDYLARSMESGDPGLIYQPFFLSLLKNFPPDFKKNFIEKIIAEYPNAKKKRSCERLFPSG